MKLRHLRDFMQRLCSRRSNAEVGQVGWGDFEVVLVLHPTWANRLQEIQAARARFDPRNGNAQLQIQFKDLKTCRRRRKWYTISWTACCEEKQTSCKSSVTSDNRVEHTATLTREEWDTPQLTAAMRDAVAPEVMAWKRAQGGGELCCAHCGKRGKRGRQFQADHYPVTFERLRREFLQSKVEEERGQVPTMFGYGRFCNPRFRLRCKTDKAFAACWRQFHEAKASFRWLCVSCNAARLGQSEN